MLVLIAGYAAVSMPQAAAADSPNQNSGSPNRKVLLQTTETPGQLRRVQAVVELSGDLKVNPDGKKVSRLPLKGQGELAYDERLVAPAGESQPRQDLRFYRQADARFAVGPGEIVTKLTTDRKLIAVQATTSQATLWSPSGPLTRDELELLDIQGSSSILDRLLPNREVSLNETWQPSNETAALLLRLEVVTDSKLECRLTKLESDTATVEMAGAVSGSVGGVASDVDVTAKLQFDTAQRRITWLAMSLKENRAVGHAEPGFELTARVRVAITALETAPELGDEATNQVDWNPEGGSFLTHTTAEKAFRFTHSRSWRVMVDRHDSTVLRFVNQGEMVAQCNLSRLPDAAPDKFLAMESFQLDIQRSLAKNFTQFVEAKQFKTDRGLRALRVVVAGLAAELPIQWIYYHLTDDSGHQAALVFTMDGKLVERFGAEDQSLVSQLEMRPEAGG